ncbi:MAG: glycerophosphodiester phosphodiesterase [Planctomycetota bacterium]
MALEIVAHRGASDEAPENTREAVEAAWKAGADAVEVDVRLTADGKLAVIHDEDAKRTTGTVAVVAKSTLEDLRKLDAGSWKGPRWKGCRIPTLEEVLATVPRGKRLFVEVKCGPEAVPELARVLRESGRAPREAVVIGFDPETMAAVRKALPDRKVYLLSGFQRDEETGSWKPRIEDLIEKAKAAGLSGLDLSAEGPLDEEAARRIRVAGLELHVWTVDDPEVARRLRALGVDGITTNRPAALRRAIEG